MYTHTCAQVTISTAMNIRAILLMSHIFMSIVIICINIVICIRSQCPLNTYIRADTHIVGYALARPPNNYCELVLIRDTIFTIDACKHYVSDTYIVEHPIGSNQTVYINRHTSVPTYSKPSYMYFDSGVFANRGYYFYFGLINAATIITLCIHVSMYVKYPYGAALGSNNARIASSVSPQHNYRQLPTFDSIYYGDGRYTHTMP